MTVAAAVALYRRQFVAAFEQRTTALRATTTKETMANGLTVTWVVSGSGNDAAVTRGVNGQIPYGSSTNSQITGTLEEKHAPYEMTGFNIFASQGDQKQIMQMNSMGVINRDIEDEIIGALGTATNDTSTAATASFALVMKAQNILMRNNVDMSNINDIFGVCSPAFRNYIMQVAQSTSGDYIDYKPLAGPVVKMWRWAGVNWHISNRVPGVGTNAEKCFIYHRSAIGYACNVGEEKVAIGYDEKQDTSWSRASIYHDAALLQNAGVVVINHDGSAYEAA
jgi:hypothetical protein